MMPRTPVTEPSSDQQEAWKKAAESVTDADKPWWWDKPWPELGYGGQGDVQAWFQNRDPLRRAVEPDGPDIYVRRHCDPRPHFASSSPVPGEGENHHRCRGPSALCHEEGLTVGPDCPYCLSSPVPGDAGDLAGQIAAIVHNYMNQYWHISSGSPRRDKLVELSASAAADITGILLVSRNAGDLAGSSERAKDNSGWPQNPAAEPWPGRPWDSLSYYQKQDVRAWHQNRDPERRCLPDDVDPRAPTPAAPRPAGEDLAGQGEPVALYRNALQRLHSAIHALSKFEGDKTLFEASLYESDRALAAWQELNGAQVQAAAALAKEDAVPPPDASGPDVEGIPFGDPPKGGR